MTDQDEKDRREHDIKSALNAICYFIRLVKSGEDFTSKDGGETIVRVEEAFTTLKNFVHEKTKSVDAN